jgi:glycosyltransferase involved in cell wall biosynthesis
MDLLNGSDISARGFAVMVLGDGYCGGLFDPLPWNQPMYVCVPPKIARPGGMVRSLFPDWPGLRRLGEWADARWNLKAKYLHRTIARWKPHIVHSLAVRPSGVFTWEVLSKMPRSSRPRWIVSGWGSDLNLGLDMPDVRPKLVEVLRNCDGFIPDSRRDLNKALRAGLDPRKVLSYEPIPGHGGCDPNAFPLRRVEAPRRDVFLVMKAHDTGVNDIGKVLQAIQNVEAHLSGYEIHLTLCSEATRALVEKLPESLRQRMHCHPMLPDPVLQGLLSRARVVVAPSTSDGTPVSMLDAMAVGAIPLFSPLESIADWIEHGVNGLLAEAGDVNAISAAMRRAVTDDELFQRAAILNRAIVLRRANRDTIRKQMLHCYRSFAYGSPAPEVLARAA